MHALGSCGGIVPNGRLLPVLVGEQVDRCPVAVAVADQEVVELADILPGPDGPGPLAHVPIHELPPRHQAFRAMAGAWVSARKKTLEADRNG